MSEGKQRFHERILDAEEGLLITTHKVKKNGKLRDAVGLSCTCDPIKMSAQLVYLFKDNVPLATLFLSSIASASLDYIEHGDKEAAMELRNLMEGVLLYLDEGMSKLQN